MKKYPSNTRFTTPFGQYKKKNTQNNEYTAFKSKKQNKNVSDAS